VLEVGAMRIDPAARIVTRAGREVELTVREFALLHFLAQRAGAVVSREELLEHVWDSGDEGSTNVVDVYVGYLRNKVEKPFRGKVIRTVRGIGFMLEAK
jgi:two-component system, OmpR family, response regulator